MSKQKWQQKVSIQYIYIYIYFTRDLRESINNFILSLLFNLQICYISCTKFCTKRSAGLNLVSGLLKIISNIQYLHIVVD